MRLAPCFRLSGETSDFHFTDRNNLNSSLHKYVQYFPLKLILTPLRLSLSASAPQPQLPPLQPEVWQVYSGVLTSGRPFVVHAQCELSVLCSVLCWLDVCWFHQSETCWMFSEQTDLEFCWFHSVTVQICSQHPAALHGCEPLMLLNSA